jgi:hypothetical protein
MLRLVCCCCATCKYTEWAGALGIMRGEENSCESYVYLAISKCKDEFKKNSA